MVRYGEKYCDITVYDFGKKNHLFRWNSFRSWRVCKQTKLSHLGHRKSASKTSHCLMRILVQRHNEAIFLRKWGKRGRYNQWRSLLGRAEWIFVHRSWREGYWQHLVSTGWRYVPLSRSYTLCCAPYFEDSIISRRTDVVWPLHASSDHASYDHALCDHASYVTMSYTTMRYATMHFMRPCVLSDYELDDHAVCEDAFYATMRHAITWYAARCTQQATRSKRLSARDTQHVRFMRPCDSFHHASCDHASGNQTSFDHAFRDNTSYDYALYDHAQHISMLTF